MALNNPKFDMPLNNETKPPYNLPNSYGLCSAITIFLQG